MSTESPRIRPGASRWGRRVLVVLSFALALGLLPPFTPAASAAGLTFTREEVESNPSTPSTLSTPTFMREEEKLAHDVYVTLGELWGAPVYSHLRAGSVNHLSAFSRLYQAQTGEAYAPQVLEADEYAQLLSANTFARGRRGGRP